MSACMHEKGGNKSQEKGKLKKKWGHGSSETSGKGNLVWDLQKNMVLTAQCKHLFCPIGSQGGQVPESPPAVPTTQCPKLGLCKGLLEAGALAGLTKPLISLRLHLGKSVFVGNPFPAVQPCIMSPIGPRPNYSQHHKKQHLT